MPTPFPGIDPYLERSNLWRQIHIELIVDIQRFLAGHLRPHYFVAIEEHSYLALLPFDDRLVDIPDVLDVASPDKPGFPLPITGELPIPETIKQRYLEIRDVATREVITIIEILSPTN